MCAKNVNTFQSSNNMPKFKPSDFEKGLEKIFYSLINTCCEMTSEGKHRKGCKNFKESPVPKKPIFIYDEECHLAQIKEAEAKQKKEFVKNLEVILNNIYKPFSVNNLIRDLIKKYGDA